MLRTIYAVPTIPITGNRAPHGTLKFLGAFGRRFLKTSTSTCASMYEIIQNTEPARIRKEIISAELSLRYPNIRIAALTNTCPNHGTLCLFVFEKIFGIIFIFAIPWQITASELTVEFCVLITASAPTSIIQTFPASPSTAYPYKRCGAAESASSPQST